jgi:hypothetical protein
MDGADFEEAISYERAKTKRVNLLRHTVYVGLREDKPAGDVRREAARSVRSN